MLARIKRILNVLLIAAISVTFVIFAVANREMAQLSLFPLPYTAEMPQFLFAILCFGLGAMFGWLTLTFKLSKSKRLWKAEHQRVMALQQEVGSLSVNARTSPPMDGT